MSADGHEIDVELVSEPGEGLGWLVCHQVAHALGPA
jgi:hypothetical protein